MDEQYCCVCCVKCIYFINVEVRFVMCLYHLCPARCCLLERLREDWELWEKLLLNRFMDEWSPLTKTMVVQGVYIFFVYFLLFFSSLMPFHSSSPVMMVLMKQICIHYANDHKLFILIYIKMRFNVFIPMFCTLLVFGYMSG